MPQTLTTMSNVIKKVQAKLNDADGDIKDAIRIIPSADWTATVNLETYRKLLEKHPPPAQDHSVFDDTTLLPVDTVTESEVKVAVFKFDNCAAGGLYGLRPQH